MTYFYFQHGDKCPKCRSINSTPPSLITKQKSGLSFFSKKTPIETNIDKLKKNIEKTLQIPAAYQGPNSLTPPKQPPKPPMPSTQCIDKRIENLVKPKPPEIPSNIALSQNSRQQYSRDLSLYEKKLDSHKNTINELNKEKDALLREWNREYQYEYPPKLAAYEKEMILYRKDLQRLQDKTQEAIKLSERIEQELNMDRELLWNRARICMDCGTAYIYFDPSDESYKTRLLTKLTIAEKLSQPPSLNEDDISALLRVPALRESISQKIPYEIEKDFSLKH